jgi:hypothetical protein
VFAQQALFFDYDLKVDNSEMSVQELCLKLLPYLKNGGSESPANKTGNS